MWEPVALCCCTRRTGCLVLGSLEVIVAILAFIAAMFLLKAGMDIPCGTSRVATEYCEQFSTIIYCILAVVMVLCVIQCVCSSMMIHGVRTNNHCLMVPFLIKNLISLVLYIIFSGIGIVGAVIKLGQHSSHSQVFYFLPPLIIFNGVVIFILKYFLLTVRAYYYELKRGKADDYHKLVENADLKHDQTNML